MGNSKTRWSFRMSLMPKMPILSTSWSHFSSLTSQNLEEHSIIQQLYSFQTCKIFYWNSPHMVLDRVRDSPLFGKSENDDYEFWTAHHLRPKPIKHQPPVIELNEKIFWLSAMNNIPELFRLCNDIAIQTSGIHLRQKAMHIEQHALVFCLQHSVALFYFISSVHPNFGDTNVCAPVGKDLLMPISILLWTMSCLSNLIGRL